jgi:L-threonylcarbamoyladenylate synthase
MQDQPSLPRAINTTTTSKENLVNAAVSVLAAGGLLIFPTETTYGAGVDATNQAAVDKLLAYKSRREGKPLSIAVTDLAMAEQYVEVNDQAKKLYQRFLPGPVTVVSKSLGQVATGVESEFGTLGVRIPNYELVLEIVKALGRPVTATSANGSGEKRPYTVQDIYDGLSDKQLSLIDLVINAGQLPPNPPSTVIDTTLSTPVVFRQGEINLEVTKDSTDPNSTLTLTSNSEAETRDIAKRLILKHWNEVKDTGLVIGLDGSLGVGKTIFTKGIAEFLQISETITSPTYTYIEEYDYNRHGVTGKLYHLDLWKIESAEELARLEIGELLKPNNVVVIEWFGQVEGWLTPSLQNTSLCLVSLFQEGDVRTLSVRD